MAQPFSPITEPLPGSSSRKLTLDRWAIIQTYVRDLKGPAFWNVLLHSRFNENLQTNNSFCWPPFNSFGWIIYWLVSKAKSYDGTEGRTHSVVHYLESRPISFRRLELTSPSRCLFPWCHSQGPEARSWVMLTSMENRDCFSTHRPRLSPHSGGKETLLPGARLVSPCRSRNKLTSDSISHVTCPVVTWALLIWYRMWNIYFVLIHVGQISD